MFWVFFCVCFFNAIPALFRSSLYFTLPMHSQRIIWTVELIIVVFGCTCKLSASYVSAYRKCDCVIQMKWKEMIIIAAQHASNATGMDWNAWERYCCMWCTSQALQRKKDFRKTSRLNWPKSSKWEKKHRLRMSQIIKHTATIAPRNKLPCPGTLNEKWWIC